MTGFKKMVMIFCIVIPMFANAIPLTNFYNVKDFGAKGDGITIDSKAINNAIETAAEAGGGTIYFPSGNYLSGSIHLKSYINLFIDEGATLIAANPDSAEYDKPEKSVNDIYQDYGHSHWHNSYIWGEKIHDISITGFGTIWGKGLIRNGKKGEIRPNKAISLLNCYNVTIENISILQGGWFALLATGVDNLALHGLKVDTNRDGFDIDCCKNVRVSDCAVNSPFDDGICLKSSFALGYARATENVTITNCQVSGYDEGTLLDGTFKRNDTKNGEARPTGRIKFGTESNGGFKNITISNCVFDYCRGLALETVDGALLEDVTISNITMRDIVNAPIFIRLGARMRGPDTIKIGECRRIILSNIVAYNVDPQQGVIISGLPGHDIKDLELNNIKIYYKGGGIKDSIKRIVPEYANAYPEPSDWKTMPSYGFFIRHVENIKMRDIQTSYMSPEQRPPFILDDVNGATFYGIQAEKDPASKYFALKNVRDFKIYESEGVGNMWLKDVVSKVF